MTSALPERRDDGPDPFGSGRPLYDVGEFPQGSPFSRWALARYIVGRVVLERVSWSLLAIALILVVLAGLSGFLLHSAFLAVVLVLLAVVVLGLRAALRSVLRRLMQAKAYGPLEQRLTGVVSGASRDVFVELRRVGLPSRLVTLPLLGLRLLGRKRAVTLAKMREFDFRRAVSKARLDELHMIVREATGAGAPGAPGPIPPANMA